MPFLTLDGTPVPLLDGTPIEDVAEIGQRGRGSDGSPRSAVRARKRVWTGCRTEPMDPTGDGATLWAILVSAPPTAAAGDLVGGAASVHVVNPAPADNMKSTRGLLVSYTFDLWEA